MWGSPYAPCSPRGRVRPWRASWTLPPSVVHKDRAPATGRRAGRLSARRSASLGRCLGGMPARIARGPRASSARSRRISFSAGREPPAAPGGVRLRACPLRRLVRERQTAPVLELDSRTTGMTLAGGGGRSGTRDNGEISNGTRILVHPLYPNYVMRYCHFRYCRLG